MYLNILNICILYIHIYIKKIKLSLLLECCVNQLELYESTNRNVHHVTHDLHVYPCMQTSS